MNKSGNFVKLCLAFGLCSAAFGAPAAARPPIRPDIKIKPRVIPGIPRGPRISPHLRDVLNIRNVFMTFNTEGTVVVNGKRCPRTFLLFPIVAMLRPVSGKVSIDTGVGYVGRASFSAGQAIRNGGIYIATPTIRFTPDWQRLGPGYQFVFKIKVDSPTGRNWRTVERGFYPGEYPRCTPR